MTKRRPNDIADRTPVPWLADRILWGCITLASLSFVLFWALPIW